MTTPAQESTTQEVSTSAEESTSPEQTTNSKTKPLIKNFYIEVDGKYVLVTKDEEGNIVPVN